MGGGKKYNIWIAYSDLFTNLSAFLFISALGLFAAIGSGVLVNAGLGSDARCSISADIKESLVRDSVITALGRGSAPSSGGGGCVEYYKIDGYRFESADLRSFRNTNGKSLNPDDMRSKLCQPIWLTLPLKSFDELNAKVAFIGIAEANGKPAYPSKCGAAQPNDPQLDGFPDRRSRSAISTIRECQISGVKAYQVCQDVLSCLARRPDERNEWCQSVMAAEIRGRQSEVACEKLVPELQAKAIYDSCEGAPLDRGFPTQRFNTDAMIPAARKPDERRALWRKVEVGALIRDGPASSSALLTDTTELVRNQPAGTVVIEVSVGARAH